MLVTAANALVSDVGEAHRGVGLVRQLVGRPHLEREDRRRVAGPSERDGGVSAERHAELPVEDPAVGEAAGVEHDLPVGDAVREVAVDDQVLAGRPGDTTSYGAVVTRMLGFRGNMPLGSYHIRRDTHSILSYTHDEEIFSIDPIHAPTDLAAWQNFLRAFNNLKSPVEDVLEVYFNQCAIRMNCRQLARAGLFLANAGQDPLNHARSFQYR